MNDELGKYLEEGGHVSLKKDSIPAFARTLRTVKERPVRIADHSAKG
jgi:hypothetical protein